MVYDVSKVYVLNKRFLGIIGDAGSITFSYQVDYYDVLGPPDAFWAMLPELNLGTELVFQHVMTYVVHTMYKFMPTKNFGGSSFNFGCQRYLIFCWIQ